MKSLTSPRRRSPLARAVGSGAVLMLAGSLLAACSTASGSSSGSSLTFSLDYAIDGLHAALFVAQSKGYYSHDKINVSLEPSDGTSQVLARLASGQAQMGIADASSVVKAISEGNTQIRAVAVLLNHDPSTTATLKSSGIQTVQGLKGATVGDTPAGGLWTVFPAFLGANGMSLSDVKRVAINQGVNSALLAGKVTAVNNYIETFATVSGKLNLIPWYQHGVNPYGSTIIVNTKYLDTHQSQVRKFLADTFKGLRTAVADPVAAGNILANAAGTGTSARYFSGEIVLLKPFWDMTGLSDPARWMATERLDQKYLGVAKSIPVGQFYTNNFLAG